MNAPVGSGRRVLNCAPPAAMAADALGAAIAPTAATPATRRALSPALRERREREKKCFTFMRLLFAFPPARVAIGVHATAWPFGALLVCRGPESGTRHY